MPWRSPHRTAHSRTFPGHRDSLTNLVKGRVVYCVLLAAIPATGDGIRESRCACLHTNSDSGSNEEASEKMKYEKVINRIVAADDLHYDAKERRFVSLSSEEIGPIVKQCQDIGMTDHGLITQTVQWCGTVRVGEIRYRSFLSGRLKIHGFSNGAPLFSPMGDAP